MCRFLTVIMGCWRPVLSEAAPLTLQTKSPSMGRVRRPQALGRRWSGVGRVRSGVLAVRLSVDIGIGTCNCVVYLGLKHDALSVARHDAVRYRAGRYTVCSA